MFSIRFDIAVEPREFAGTVPVIQGAEKIYELLKIYTHLEHQLA
jgi:hypothetical protein